MPFPRFYFLRFFFWGVSFFVFSTDVFSSVFLRVTAENPSELEEKEVKVRTFLPKRIKPENIRDLDELELAYSSEQDQYYAFKDIVLKAKEIKTFEIEIDDIWLIDENKLELYQHHAKRLFEKLEQTEHETDGGKLLDELLETSQLILKNQQDAKVSDVGPIPHIQAFEANLPRLKGILHHLGRLENLVIQVGEDPEIILGESSSVGGEKLKNIDLQEGAVESIVFRLEVKNPSKTRKLLLPVYYELPHEVQAVDILDSDELEVGFDYERSIVTLSKKNVLLQPEENKTFEIVIKDKWSLSAEVLTAHFTHVDELLTKMKDLKEIPSAQDLGKQIQSKINSLRLREPSNNLKEQVENFEKDKMLLERITHDIGRLENILIQIEVHSGELENVISKSTTWKVIYGIVGFLGLMSLAFFLAMAKQISAKKALKNL